MKKLSIDTFKIFKYSMNMTKTYTIGEFAERFGIHRDTLRNWEKEGILVPDRVGTRGDRVYTEEHVAIVADKKLAQSVVESGKTLSPDQMDLGKLKAFLWKSADILRGKIDSSDYKKYIFGLLFYKRMSDVWQEEYEKALAEFHDEDIALADYNHRFQVPKDARFEIVQNTAANIGLKLNEVFDKITNANSPKLDKIFDDLDFANSDRFPNETLQALINHFGRHKFGENYFSSDVLGDAYEYLIQQFAADAGKKGGEFYTPREVERLIMHILKPHEKDHVYDPTAGSGGFLLEAYQYVRDTENEQKARSLYLYGQELNISTYAIAKINMFLHGLDGADIRRGDTLVDPQFTTAAGTLKTFDIVVANFPYSIKEWPYEKFKNDRFGRHDGYETPPTKNADYAFILHIIKSLNENGRAGVVVPHGVLFRGGAEGRIREQMIKNDLIEAVIALPSKLFYGTGIPAAILILNKNKRAERKGSIVIIDAEGGYEEGKNQNRLRKADIQKIAQTLTEFQAIERYSSVVSTQQVGENGYDLNIRHYVDTHQPEESVSMVDLLQELDHLKVQKKIIEKEVTSYIDKLSLVELKSFPIRSGGWKSVLLKDVVKKIRGGGTPTVSVRENYVGNVPFVKIDDITSGRKYLSATKVNISEVALNTSSAWLVPSGSILYTIYATLGEVAITKNDVATNQAILGIVADNSLIDTEFLYYFLKQNKDAIRRQAKQGTQKNLTKEIVENYSINLPPIEMQREIVKVLALLDSLIAIDETISGRYKVLQGSLTRDLLGDKACVGSTEGPLQA